MKNQGDFTPDEFNKKLQEVRLFIYEMLKQGKIKRSDEKLVQMLLKPDLVDLDGFE